MAVKDALLLPHQAGSESATPVGQPDMEVLMRNFLQKTPTERSESRASNSDIGKTLPKRDIDTAVNLLEHASQALEALAIQCQRLEQEYEASKKQAEAQANDQEQALEQWRQLASGLKAQLEQADQRLERLKAKQGADESRAAALEARALAAEARVADLEQASMAAAEHAAMAENLSTQLHDKIVNAFGSGSRVHPILASVLTRMAAE